MAKEGDGYDGHKVKPTVIPGVSPTKIRLAKYQNILTFLNQIHVLLYATYPDEEPAPDYIFQNLLTLQATVYYEMALAQQQHELETREN